MAKEDIASEPEDSTAIDDLFLGEDPDGPQPGLHALEEKYRDQMRQIVPQKIELPLSTLPSMFDNQINLNPDFQRRSRWDLGRKSRFIESLIMNVPIPSVFLGEDDYGLPHEFRALAGHTRVLVCLRGDWSHWCKWIHY